MKRRESELVLEVLIVISGLIIIMLAITSPGGTLK
jgi:hypothetical protein